MEGCTFIFTSVPFDFNLTDVALILSVPNCEEVVNLKATISGYMY